MKTTAKNIRFIEFEMIEEESHFEDRLGDRD